MQLTKRAFLLSGAALAVSAASGAFAMGTPSGFAVVGFAKQGDLGEVISIPIAARKAGEAKAGWQEATVGQVVDGRQELLA